MIEIKDVCKSFRKEMVIHPVTARFGDGKITGIIGRNGSGKTVLFKMICGLVLPDSGEIIVNGERVGKYSLGMRQRLGIAQAIMEEPDVLILDEPMNGLDRQGVEEMRKLFLELKGQGKTILMASHNREDIEVLCDEVYEMEAGVLSERLG